MFPKRYFLYSIFAFVVAAQTAYSQQLLDRYEAVIGQQDRFNSSGARLTKPSQILTQDRANFHRFDIRHPGDTSDSYFNDRQNRANFASLLGRGEIDRDAENALLHGSNPTLVVEVFGIGGRAQSIRVSLKQSNQIDTPSVTNSVRPVQQIGQPSFPSFEGTSGHWEFRTDAYEWSGLALYQEATGLSVQLACTRPDVSPASYPGDTHIRPHEPDVFTLMLSPEAFGLSSEAALQKSLGIQVSVDGVDLGSAPTVLISPEMKLATNVPMQHPIIEAIKSGNRLKVRETTTGRELSVGLQGSSNAIAQLTVLCRTPLEAITQEPKILDCVSAGNIAEQTICAEPSLAARDSELSKAYETALVLLNEYDRDTLVGKQQQWIKQRNACGNQVKCLANSLDWQLAYIRKVVQLPTKNAVKDTSTSARNSLDSGEPIGSNTVAVSEASNENLRQQSKPQNTESEQPKSAASENIEANEKQKSKMNRVDLPDISSNEYGQRPGFFDLDYGVPSSARRVIVVRSNPTQDIYSILRLARETAGLLKHASWIAATYSTASSQFENTWLIEYMDFSTSPTGMGFVSNDWLVSKHMISNSPDELKIQVCEYDRSNHDSPEFRSRPGARHARVSLLFWSAPVPEIMAPQNLQKQTRSTTGVSQLLAIGPYVEGCPDSLGDAVFLIAMNIAQGTQSGDRTNQNSMLRNATTEGPDLDSAQGTGEVESLVLDLPEYSDVDPERDHKQYSYYRPDYKAPLEKGELVKTDSLQSFIRRLLDHTASPAFLISDDFADPYAVTGGWYEELNPVLRGESSGPFNERELNLLGAQNELWQCQYNRYLSEESTPPDEFSFSGHPSFLFWSTTVDSILSAETLQSANGSLTSIHPLLAIGPPVRECPETLGNALELVARNFGEKAAYRLKVDGPGEGLTEDSDQSLIVSLLGLKFTDFRVAPDPAHPDFKSLQIDLLDPDGPAYKAGLRSGDFVGLMDWLHIRDTAEATRHLLYAQDNKAISIGWHRGEGANFEGGAKLVVLDAREERTLERIEGTAARDQGAKFRQVIGEAGSTIVSIPLENWCSEWVPIHYDQSLNETQFPYINSSELEDAANWVKGNCPDARGFDALVRSSELNLPIHAFTIEFQEASSTNAKLNWDSFNKTGLDGLPFADTIEKVIEVAQRHAPLCDRYASHSQDPQRRYGLVGTDFVVPEDIPKAIDACIAALEQDPEDVLTNFHMGRVLYEAQLFEEAFLYLEYAAYYEHGGAADYLGSMYMNGDGVEADEELSEQYFAFAESTGFVPFADADPESFDPSGTFEPDILRFVYEMSPRINPKLDIEGTGSKFEPAYVAFLYHTLEEISLTCGSESTLNGLKAKLEADPGNLDLQHAVFLYERYLPNMLPRIRKEIDVDWFDPGVGEQWGSETAFALEGRYPCASNQMRLFTLNSTGLLRS